MNNRKTFVIAGLLTLGVAIWILITRRPGFGWIFIASLICLRVAFPGKDQEERQ